jgi:prepilin-type N-terminal cleavage/methylation domain-containing protein
MMYINKNKGFTLIEIIVSLAVFTMVAVIAVGAFLKITDANKKSQTLKTAINNINFAMESMTREMRVGSGYHCDDDVRVNFGIKNSDHLLPKPCTEINVNSDVYIMFDSSKTSDQGGASCNLSFIYYFKFDNTTQSGTFYKAEQRECNDNIKNFEMDEDRYVPIISPDVVITNFSVDVTDPGPRNDPDNQPKIWMRIKGYTGVREVTRTYYDIQTTVSQRAPI